MFNSTAVSGTPQPRRPGRHLLTRVALPAVALVGLILSSPAAAAAQSHAAPARAWEFRAPSGAFVPTGDHRDVLKDAHVSAAQVAWLVSPHLALTGTVAWARSRDLISVDTPKLDVFTSDLGIEARSSERTTAGATSFSAFAGLGAGVRSYNHRSLDVDAAHHLAGYGAVGGEVARGRVGLRLEVRDYVTGFKPLVSGGESELRNDMAVTVALRFRTHPKSRDRE